MEKRRFYMVVVVAAVVALTPTLVFAQADENGDKTLSPYFFIPNNDSGLEQLPLKSTDADVSIAGVIADVVVTQVYQNTGKKPIEAVYVFPASTRAAVYGMKMIIGERVVEAKIRKRDDARKEYEQARQEGKNASLLEQQRPNVFQMNVANIMPGDQIRVELRYTELIVPKDKVYEFVYPTVVGPRYSSTKAENAPKSEQWVSNPYLHEGQAPSYSFGIKAALAAGFPIADISSPSHKVNVSYSGPDRASVSLDASESAGGNRDFILRYRLDGGKIQSGMLLFEGADENYFLMMVQPPERVTNAAIPGREYIFIVDVSGSMHGYPLEISKQLLRNLIGGLRKFDRFNVILFAGSSQQMSPESVEATQGNVDDAIRMIDHQSGGGGTEMLPALERALSIKKPENFSRTVVIATDGYVSVEERVFDLIGKNLGKANMFAFGIGTSVNRHLIEGMAHVGMGEPFVIAKPDQAAARAEEFRKMIASPVLTQIKVGFEGFDAYDVEPMGVPDVLAERPVIVFGKYRGKAKGRATLMGITGSGRYGNIIEMEKVSASKANSALRYLWARHRIQILADYNNLHSTDARVKEVTGLGLKYNLLTAYTSFVAVDSIVRNKSGDSTQVNQPLPLPEGVSDYAVGQSGSMSATTSAFGGQGYGLVRKGSAPAPMAIGSLGTRGAGGAVGEESAADRSVAECKEVQKKDQPAKTKVSGKLSLESLKVEGGLSTETVKNLVVSKMGQLARCLAYGEPDGKIVIEVEVAADGSVKSANVVSGIQGKESGARWCMTGLIEKWSFGAAPDGKVTKIRITLRKVS